MRIGQPLTVPAAVPIAPPDPQQMLEQGQVLAVQTNEDKVTLFDPSGHALGNGSSSAKLNTKVKIREALLPADYPNSVSKDYLACRKWNAVRNFAASVSSYMGTAAALEAVGVGAGPLTVGLAWMLRDSVDGAGKFIGSIHAKEADRDPRGMVYKGEIINNAGCLIESTMSLLPGAYLGIMPAAQVVKAIGSSYRSAAEGPIDNHQAIAHNLGDMRAKNNNQDLVVNAVGGAFAFGIDKLGRHYLGPAAAPILVAGAAVMRIWATHNYVNALDLNPLSEKSVLKSVSTWLGEKSAKDTGLDKMKKLELGAKIDSFVDDPQRFQYLTGLYAGKNYLLDVQDEKIRVILRQNSGADEQLQAVFQAALVQRLQHGASYRLMEQKDGKKAADQWAVETSLRALPPNATAILGNPAPELLRFDVDGTRSDWKDAPAANLPPVSLAEFKKLL